MTSDHTAVTSDRAAATSDRAAASAPRQTVLFTGGLGRSGSTLIEKLLNELPGTFSVGETVHLWERGVRDQERCGCGEPFAACAHWAAVGQTAFGGWDEVDIDRLIELRWSIDRSRRLPQIFAAVGSDRRRTRQLNDDELEYVSHLRRVLLAASETAGQPQVLLESSKHLSTAALLATDPALDVRVLHLVRDPRGVAYSWTKEVKRPEAGADEVMPTYRPERTAMRWVTDNLGFRTLSSLGVATTTLRYEDFLASPADAIRSIAVFAGLSLADGPLDFLEGDRAKLRTPMHSIAGNPLRFGGADLTLRLDDAWKTKLDPTSRRIVTGITAPVLNHFGYSLRG